MLEVPAEKRLGFCQRRQMFVRYRALDCDASQIDDFQIGARAERLDCGRSKGPSKARLIAEQAKKDGLARLTKRTGVGG